MDKSNLSTYYFDKFKEILEKNDIEEYLEKINTTPDSTSLREALTNYTQYEYLIKTQKSILGIDIYRYSKYPTFEQILIPVIFQILFEKAIEYSIDYNQFIFQKLTRGIINERFISTGDGGFHIFDSPLHALLFAINFSIALRQYNSFHLYPRLRNIIGELNLRYTLTYDEVYKYENNFFGSSIINNSRIIGKDTLNRCLLDHNTFAWFMLNFNGIENLQSYMLDNLLELEEFSNYDKKYFNGNNYLFHNDPDGKHGIISCDIQKIGNITAKETQLSIYNLALKILVMSYDKSDSAKQKFFTISFGNLNSLGFG